MNPLRQFVCQLHSAALRNVRTTVYDRHAPTVPTRSSVQGAR